MILNALAAKLKRRAKDAFKGPACEATLIVHVDGDPIPGHQTALEASRADAAADWRTVSGANSRANAKLARSWTATNR